MRFLASACLLVAAWAFVRVEDLFTAACCFVVAGSSLRLLLEEVEE